MLADTRDSADSAIKAANAYADIVVAIQNAQQAEADAVVAADNAISKVSFRISMEGCKKWILTKDSSWGF